MTSLAPRARTATLTASIALALALSACSTSTPVEPVSSAGAGADGDAASAPASATEAATRTPRIVATYDGGILVLDALTLEVEADLPVEGFTRVSPAGDGRHVAVSTTGGWAMVDAGTWSRAHGDHAHHYTAEPALHDVLLEAGEPGHVVVHDGLTAFYDDATGHVSVVEAHHLAEMVEAGEVAPVREYTAAEPHHGVAVVNEDGVLMITLGDEDGRTGAMLLDGDDEVIVASEECPGVHGETVFDNAAGEELFMVGCEDGVLAFHGDHVHKIDAGVEFARTGNLHAVSGNDIVLGDRRTDPEGGIALTEIVLIDPEAETISVVDPFPGASAEYTWRGLARGADGEALVLGTDGALRVIDETTGELVRAIDVVAAWEAPEDWQLPHPALFVLDGMAYVTEPATGEVHIVDYVGGEVWRSVDVGAAVNEVAVAAG